MIVFSRRSLNGCSWWSVIEGFAQVNVQWVFAPVLWVTVFSGWSLSVFIRSSFSDFFLQVMTQWVFSSVDRSVRGRSCRSFSDCLTKGMLSDCSLLVIVHWPFTPRDHSVRYHSFTVSPRKSSNGFLLQETQITQQMLVLQNHSVTDISRRSFCEIQTYFSTWIFHLQCSNWGSIYWQKGAGVCNKISVYKWRRRIPPCGRIYRSR